MENNIPSNWSWVKVSILGELLRGVSYKKEEASDKPADSRFPILRANNINGSLNFDDLVYVPKVNITKGQLIRKGDIVFAMSSGSKNLVGKSAQAKTDFDGGFGAFCGLFRCNDSVNKTLVAFFFQSPSYKKFITEISKGTNINNLKREHILNLDFPLPPLPEQHCIVAKIETLFSELDKGIESLKTAQQQLKVYRQAVLKWAFEGKLTEGWRTKNRNGKPKVVQAQTGQQQSMAAEPEVEYGRIDGLEPVLPEEWSWKQLEEVSNAFGGYAFKSPDFKEKGKYQVIRIGNVRPGVLRLSEKPVFIDCDDENILSRSRLQNGDIIITLTGTKKKRDYGFTTSISDSNFLLNQRLAAIRFSKDYLPKFFLYYSWTDTFKDQFFAHETGNVGQGNVGMKAVTKTQVPLLSLEEQHQIVSEIERRLSVCDKLETTIEENLHQAEALRQSILKKAFEGKLITN